MLAVLDQNRCSFTSPEHVKSAYRSSFSSTEIIIKHLQPQDLDVNLGAFAPLPNEVITLVFRHMSSARDVCALSASARLFYCLGNDQTLWRDMCLKHYGDQVVATTNKHFIAFGKDWIWLYKSKVELKASTGVGLKKVQNRGTLQGEWVEDQLQGYGVQVVTKEDDEDESAWGLYEGMWAEGKRSGKGYWYGADGSYFEGQWREGKEERGLSKWTDGDSYDGEWRDGEKNGHGKYMWADGSWYDGEWKDGEEDGAGKFMWSDGDWYEGEWANGKKNGRGRYTWTDGSWYEGDWQNSQRHGWGVRVWGKGSKWEGDKYEGEWSDGDMHGRGRYTYADGSYYEGEWAEGKMHGRGKYTWADGGWYEGEFRNDNFHGTGVRVWGVGHEREGDRFVGTWTEDRMEVGIYFRRNGDRYEGPFKEGKENGLGVMFFGGHRNDSRHHQAGDVYRGMFKDGLMHGEGFYAQAGTGETFQGEWIGGVVVRRLCTIIASGERKRKRRETN